MGTAYTFLLDLDCITNQNETNCMFIFLGFFSFKKCQFEKMLQYCSFHQARIIFKIGILSKLEEFPKF